jgi:hypothetical protein
MKNLINSVVDIQTPTEIETEKTETFESALAKAVVNRRIIELGNVALS